MSKPRWYCLSREGMATLCTCEADAKIEAAIADENWPQSGPHRAVQLVEPAALLAEVDALRVEVERLKHELAIVTMERDTERAIARAALESK